MSCCITRVADYRIKNVIKRTLLEGEMGIIDQTAQVVKEAFDSEGFFITITIREGDGLKHYQARDNFLDGDVLPSLNHVKNLVQQELGQNFKNLGLRRFS